MDTTHGRRVKTIEEAQAFIREFMDETLNNPSETGYGKSYDFDLFLPWMMDWVLNVPHAHEEEFTPTNLLDVLYMDAAWDLCLKGILRPGTRIVSGEGVGGEYGKGYSLTPAGRTWLNESTPATRSQDPPSDV